MSQFPLISSYKIVNSWITGYQVDVTITNSTNTPTTTWTSSFSLPIGQTLSSSWDCVMKNTGSTYTASNPIWWGGGVIPANSSSSYGMVVQNPLKTQNTLLNLTAVANGTVTPTPPPIPVTPTLNPITSSGNTYTVSWNTIPNATSYTLQQSANSSFTNAITLTVSETSHSVNNATNGTYYYRVAASNSSGTSNYSNVQSITINVTSIASPTLSPINNNGSSTYTVSWTVVPNASYYILTENTNIIYQGSNTTFTVIDKPVGTYSYTVTATSGTISSAPSNTVTQSIPQSNTFVEGYWESWASDSVDSIVNMKINIYDISFGTFKSTGSNTFVISGIDASPSVITNFVTAVHQAGKKVKLSVGGASYPLSSFLTSTAAAQGMANAVATYVQQNNLDGVDYDIEDFPSATLQIALIQATRNLLPNKIISYTPMTPASTTQPYATVIQGAHSYLSYISIMAYNAYRGYSYANDISAMIKQGVPASKICLGLMPGKDDIGVMTSLTDVINAANYVKANGLAGLMYWSLNRDLNNITGLGPSAVANAVYPILG